MKREITVPTGFYNNDTGAFTPDKSTIVSAKIVRGFAVFYDEVRDEVSITHIPSGGAIWQTYLYRTARKICLALDSVRIGNVRLADLSACDIVEFLPTIKDRVVAIAEEIDTDNLHANLSGDAFKNRCASWSEYLHCRREAQS